MTFARHMHWFSRSIAVAVTLLTVVALQSCGKDDRVILPEGTQTISGTVHTVDLSLSRRGTHVLRSDGEDVYYLESPQMDLRDYEYLRVIATGELEYNTDPQALPVLVLSSISLPDLSLSTVSVPLYNITLGVPLNWTLEEFDDGAAFTTPTSIDPVVRLYASPTATMPRGKPVSIGGRAGILSVGTGSVAAYVRSNQDILVIASDQYSSEQEDELQVFLRVVRTLRFSAATSSTPRIQSSSEGTATPGAPCGGVAGVLCPTGSYCEITDRSLGIGRCKSL